MVFVLEAVVVLASSVCLLMDEKRLVWASWWEGRGLCELLDGKDCLWVQLGLALLDKAMLSKSLIQFPGEGWGCAPLAWGGPVLKSSGSVCILINSVLSNSLQPYGLHSSRLFYPWDFPGNDTGVECHALHEGILSTQGSNCILHCGWILLLLSPQGSQTDSIVGFCLKWMRNLALGQILYEIFQARPSAYWPGWQLMCLRFWMLLQ